MKVLLVAINSKYIHMNPAVYSLKACAGKWEDSVHIREFTINQPREKILEGIYEEHADMIAFSCYIWNISMVSMLLPELHAIMPQIPLWLGGPEVSYRAEEVKKQFPYVRGVMVGEGEIVFRRVLDAMFMPDEENTDISALPPMNMDDIPFWYEHENFDDRILYYESSRGCPYRCGYCLSSLDKSLRFRSVEKTCRDIQWFLDHSIKQVKFVDRTFNCNAQRAQRIWSYIAENDNGVTNFHFEIAGDLITSADIELISTMRPGLIQLEIGVQSTNEEVLHEVARHCDMTKLSDNIRQLLALGNVHIHLDLIAGLPKEKLSSFRQSFNDVYAFLPEQLQLGFLKVLPGTQIHAKRKEYGIVHSENPPYEVLQTKDISYEELLQLKKIEEVLDIFYNSNQFVTTLRILERAFTSPYEMYQELALYFEMKGYFLMNPARAYRYEVLLDFAIQKDASLAECYREALLYDVYLRENAKTRPTFAPDADKDRERIREFYRIEEQDRKILKDYEGYSARQMIRMTHMEGFYYTVWEETIRHNEYKTYLCFDYESRNPLTHNASVIIVGQ